MKHPLDQVTWRDPGTMQANDYNPNRVASPEMQLLKESILATGWTQPVVVRELDEHDTKLLPEITHVIVDGFHRWTLARTDAEIMDVSNGLVPTVLVDADPTERRLATVRHNRARGSHGILRMGVIVEQLRSQGLRDEDICKRMGLHIEELRRLADTGRAADIHRAEEYSEGWRTKRR